MSIPALSEVMTVPPHSLKRYETVPHQGHMRTTYLVENSRFLPTPEAKAAFARIKAAMDALDPQDMKLIRAFHGNPVLYTMTSRENPVSAEQMVEYQKQAEADVLARNPGATLVTSWICALHSQPGVSVVFREAGA